MNFGWRAGSIEIPKDRGGGGGESYRERMGE